MSAEHEEDDKHYRRLLRRLRRMDPGRVAAEHAETHAPSAAASFESVVATIRARREEFERSHRWAPWCRPVDKFHIRFANLWLRERGYTNEAIDGLVGRWLSGHEDQVAPAGRAVDDPGTFFYAIEILARQCWLATLTEAERERAFTLGLVRDGGTADEDGGEKN